MAAEHACLTRWAPSRFHYHRGSAFYIGKLSEKVLNEQPLLSATGQTALAAGGQVVPGLQNEDLVLRAADFGDFHEWRSIVFYTVRRLDRAKSP